MWSYIIFVPLVKIIGTLVEESLVQSLSKSNAIYAHDRKLNSQKNVIFC